MTMNERRYEFVVTRNENSLLKSCGWICSLGNCDLNCLTGSGETPSEAIIDWLELHDHQIDGNKS